jgi:hypothetical protein
MSFGLVYAALLEDRIYRHHFNEQFEYFDYVKRLWCVHPMRSMNYIIESYGYIFRDHDEDDDDSLPTPLSSSSFIYKVIGCINSLIRRCDVVLDDDKHTRHMLLFENGMVYDFKAGELRENRPEYRLYYRSPWTPVEFEHEEKVRAVCAEVYEYYAFCRRNELRGTLQKEARQQTTTCDSSTNTEGRQSTVDAAAGLGGSALGGKASSANKSSSLGLSSSSSSSLAAYGKQEKMKAALQEQQARLADSIVAKLKELNNPEICPMLHYLFGPDRNWDSVMYKLRCASRTACGHDCFTESLVLVGPEGSGKDFLTMILQTFFGEGPQNLTGAVPAQYFMKDAASAEAATPFLLALRGKLMLVLGDAKAEGWQTQKFKQFVEMGGARFAVRDNYAKAGEVVMMLLKGMLWISSNNLIQSSDQDDTAFQNRLTQIDHVYRFVETPARGTNQLQCIPELKSIAGSGKFNAELWCWIRHLYRTLGPEICSGRRMVPKPDTALANSEELEAFTINHKIKEWILESCTFSESKEDASAEAEVKKAIKNEVIRDEGKKAKLNIILNRLDFKFGDIKNSKGLRVIGWSAHPHFAGKTMWITLKPPQQWLSIL